MRLVISCGSHLYDVGTVCLKNGYLPSICDYSPVNSDNLPEIEPAQWFKVEVFPMMLIDCNNLTVKLDVETTVALEDVDDIEVLTLRQISTDDTCEAEYDLAELFRVIPDLPLHSDRPADRAEVNKILLRYLHFYILPLVRLLPGDETNVRKVSENLNAHLTRINDDLQARCREIVGTKQAVAEKRERMVQELQDAKCAREYPHELLLLLEAQLLEDINGEERTLALLLSDVNSLKKRDSSSGLPDKRISRDVCQERLVALVNARENIVSALTVARKAAQQKRRWSRTRQKFGADAEHAMYMQVFDFLQEQRKKRATLNRRKDFVLSVRAAVDETLKKLRGGEETLGVVNNRKNSQRATDILQYATIPNEWRSVSDQVAAIMNDVDHDLRRKHDAFVRTVVDECAKLCDELRDHRSSVGPENRPTRRQSFRNEMQSLVLDSSESDPVRDAVFSSIKTRSPSLESIGLVVVNPSAVEVMKRVDVIERSKKSLKLLQECVHAHFDLMCSEFQVAIDTMHCTVYYKVWLCYEVYFYEQTMSSLAAAFRLVYENVSENLRSSLDLGQISYEQLGIQEPWIIDLVAHEDNVNDEVFEDKRRNLIREDSREDICDSSDVDDRSKIPRPGDDEIDDKVNDAHVVLLPNSGVEDSSAEAAEILDEIVSKLELSTGETSSAVELVSTRSADHNVAENLSVSRSGTAVAGQVKVISNQIRGAEMDSYELQRLAETLRRPREPYGSDAAFSGDRRVRSMRCVPNSRMRVSRDLDSRRFERVFRPAIDCARRIVDESTPMHKLELMTKCVRLVQQIVTTEQSRRVSAAKTLMCCDDFLTIMPLLLSHTGPDKMAELYPQVTLLVDFMAPFLSSGIHANSLTHFYGAYHFIFSVILTTKAKD
ncbi:uncharacterized protein LOC141908333 [Tubulanus polymorphus]|uniref:uncharacterized protein LOC141908333 n=1 Tax=Tubulanus polymorphus TaxID=672921 RepID=UPI003DA61D95